jgi:cysteine peptidase C11 family protein
MKKNWTIMVYIGADDTLANFAVASLEQLRDHVPQNATVVAMFDPDGDSHVHAVRCYAFDHTSRGKTLESLDDPQLWSDEERRNIDMTNPETLSAFINRAAELHQAENYCLFLWGHGPELLFQLPVRKATDKSKQERRLYFTPVNLKEALQRTIPFESKKLRIIGIDACSMSMVEVACELKGLADCMLASQEEVPDSSFPYPELMSHFAGYALPSEICQMSVSDYVRAYQDCIYNEATGMHPVTLAGISLDEVKMTNVQTALRSFVAELISAQGPAVKAIFHARKETKSFAGGLFVDLHDFCDKLHRHKSISISLKAACNEVSRTIEAAVQSHDTVSDNAHARTTHGLSIYFPYVMDKQDQKYLEQPLVKGIPRMLDKGIFESYQSLNTMAKAIRYLVRQEIIKDIDRCYIDSKFEFAQQTQWFQFIGKRWNSILAELEPESIDTQYLVQEWVMSFAPEILGGKTNGLGIAG